MMRPITARRQGENASTVVATTFTGRSEQFRAHAAECNQIAEHYSDSIREQYEALARQWLVVAEQAHWQ
jgi:23S rRNA-/tRNA-specific pseudouridylate synthase